MMHAKSRALWQTAVYRSIDGTCVANQISRYAIVGHWGMLMPYRRVLVWQSSLFVVLEVLMFHFTCPMLENAIKRLGIWWVQYHTELWLLLARRRIKVWFSCSNPMYFLVFCQINIAWLPVVNFTNNPPRAPLRGPNHYPFITIFDTKGVLCWNHGKCYPFTYLQL